MLRSLFSGVSGMRTHQLDMDVIADNIANVNTTGFKASRMTFKEVYSQLLRGARGPMDKQGGINPLQVGLGVTTGSIDTLFTQGAPQATGRTTDLAIDGNGFFVLTPDDGTTKYYTRAGNFSVDSAGNLVYVNGMKVMGYEAINGEIQANFLKELVIPVGKGIEARATDQVSFAGNLDARTNGELKIPSLLLKAQDGTERAMRFDVTPTGDFNTWNWVARWADTGEAISNASGTIRTDKDGVVQEPPTAPKFEVMVGNTFFTVTGPASGSSVTTGFSSTERFLTFSDLTIMDPDTNTAATLTVMVSASNSTSSSWTWNWTLLRSGVEVGSGTITVDDTGNITSATGSGGPITIGNDSVTINPPSSGLLAGAAFTITGGNATLTGGQATYTTAGPGESVVANFGVAKPVKRDVRIFDSLGNERFALLVLEKSSDNEWKWELKDPAGVAGSYGSGTLMFDGSGRLTSGTLGDALIPASGGSDPIKLKLDFSGLTQFANETVMAAPMQNGYKSGSFVNFTIDDRGVIKGSYSNGQVRDLGQIALVTFSNQEALVKVSDTLFRESPNTGGVDDGEPGTEGKGTVIPGFLEMSNVDLSQEFTNLILAQRGFQANSRVITTSDEMLQELMTLKR